MRITNQMMTNNSLNNVNKNKNLMNVLGEQYSSGKKIQRPSDDPIIAVRALKLRTNVSELTQYYKKNIPDAMSWMEVTESALTNINTIFTNMHTQMNAGSNDTLAIDERDGIIKNLAEMKSQIYQEGNANYAGRYVFTGYKTDTSLTYTEADKSLRYEIIETFSGKDIKPLTKIVGGYELGDYDPTNPDPDNFGNAPTTVDSHRIRLSYGNLDDVDPIVTGLTEDAGGTPATITKVSSTDPNAYVVGPKEVKYIVETGELIIGADVYENSRLATDGGISVTYEKSNFAKDDLRPENYFNCKTSDATDPTKAVINDYIQRPEGQKIKYEITYNQKLTVNTEGRDTITHGIGRDIDELVEAAKEVQHIEGKVKEVDKLLEDPNITPAQQETLLKMKEQLGTELVLKNKVLHDKFEEGMGSIKKYQERLNIAVADSGSRYNRLELTESRMQTQLDDAVDLMSNNEDADVVETLIKYTSVEAIYNASLASAAKIVKNSLLDFI